MATHVIHNFTIYTVAYIHFVLLKTIILQISGTFGEWSNTINAIPLTQTVPEDGTLCKVSGWGYTAEVCQTESKMGIVHLGKTVDYMLIIVNQTRQSPLNNSL